MTVTVGNVYQCWICGLKQEWNKTTRTKGAKLLCWIISQPLQTRIIEVMIFRITTKILSRIYSGMFCTPMTRHAFTIDHQSTSHKLIITPAPDVCQSYLQQVDIYVVLWAACPFAILWLCHSCCQHPLTRHKIRKCLTYIPLKKPSSDRKITLSDGDGF